MCFQYYLLALGSIGSFKPASFGIMKTCSSCSVSACYKQHPFGVRIMESPSLAALGITDIPSSSDGHSEDLDNLLLFLIEIKKAGARDDDLNGDQRKLPTSYWRFDAISDRTFDQNGSGNLVAQRQLHGSRRKASLPRTSLPNTPALEEIGAMVMVLSPELVFVPAALRWPHMRMGAVLARPSIPPLQMRVCWKATWGGGVYR
ncbi:MAG: hypothetical protein JOS17DRAFT_818378 [Linnemannia elongata]|nr:MAG: hypothetical protein JOS17DRAFT_818378 [Linnemannia elongata]